jgi:hypothetical protein
LAVGLPFCRASERGHSPINPKGAEHVKRSKHGKALLPGINNVVAIRRVRKKQGSPSPEQAAAIPSSMPLHNASIPVWIGTSRQVPGSDRLTPRANG